MLESVNIDINLLLCGDVNLPLHINNRVFAAVHKFLDESCRFSYNCFQFYHFSIICMTYCYIRRGTSNYQNLFLILLNNLIKYIQNNFKKQIHPPPKCKQRKYFENLSWVTLFITGARMFPRYTQKPTSKLHSVLMNIFKNKLLYRYELWNVCL